jgi:Nuclease-related domain
MTEPEANRSPIKAKPLRHAGQSLEEQRRELVLDSVLPHFMAATLFVCFLVLEWGRYLTNSKPNPFLASVVASPYIGFVVWRFLRVRRKLKSLDLGIEGERVVGQFLERTREQGYAVFHDILGPDFNIDHVLIGPGGVFTVETKTWSKPVRGDARIRFDGETLLAGTQTPDRSPIVQARAQASWLKNELLEVTGMTFEVFPVVLFPGWFVEQSEGSLRSMWVLEPKALPAFLQREPQRLETHQHKMAATQLSRLIRTTELERERARAKA